MTESIELHPRAASAAPAAMSTRDRTVIGVLLVATFVVILNETIMAVALPVLMTDLGVTPSVGQWLTAGFLLTMSVIIPITGFLIRRVPTRPLYGVAMGLFSTRHARSRRWRRGSPCCSARASCRPAARRSCCRC